MKMSEKMVTRRPMWSNAVKSTSFHTACSTPHSSVLSAYSFHWLWKYFTYCTFQSWIIMDFTNCTFHTASSTPHSSVYWVAFDCEIFLLYLLYFYNCYCYTFTTFTNAVFTQIVYFACFCDFMARYVHVYIHICSPHYQRCLIQHHTCHHPHHESPTSTWFYGQIGLCSTRMRLPE